MLVVAFVVTLSAASRLGAHVLLVSFSDPQHAPATEAELFMSVRVLCDKNHRHRHRIWSKHRMAQIDGFVDASVSDAMIVMTISLCAPDDDVDGDGGFC